MYKVLVCYIEFIDILAAFESSHKSRSFTMGTYLFTTSSNWLNNELFSRHPSKNRFNLGVDWLSFYGLLWVKPIRAGLFIGLN